MISAQTHRLRAFCHPARACLMLCLCAAASLRPLSAQSANSNTAGMQARQRFDAYIRAKEAFEGKDYGHAAKLFAEVESMFPKQTDSLLFQGKSLFNLGDFSNAHRVLERYLAQDPKSSEALYLLGYVLQRENKPKESLDVFTRAAALQPPKANDLKLVGLDYVLLDDYRDAIRWLTKSVEMDPNDSEAWYDLGRAQMTKGHFVEAEQDLKRALAISPKYVKAENNLGLVYEAENRTNDALEAYHAAVTWQAGTELQSEQPLLNYGTLLVLQNRGAEAISALESAIKLAPGNAVCNEQLARAYLQLGNIERAATEMSRATQLDPGNSRFHYELGRIYRKAGMKDKAQKEFEISAELYGTKATPEGK